MITNKYGTPRERITKIVLCLLFITLIALFNGAGKSFYLSQYEEVCSLYQKNVTAEKHCRCTSMMQYANYCNWECCHCPPSGKEYYYTHDYIQTDNCVEYQLVRKTNIEPFNRLYDWCTVFPDSEDCVNKPTAN